MVAPRFQLEGYPGQFQYDAAGLVLTPDTTTLKVVSFVPGLPPWQHELIIQDQETDTLVTSVLHQTPTSPHLDHMLRTYWHPGILYELSRTRVISDQWRRRPHYTKARFEECLAPSGQWEYTARPGVLRAQCQIDKHAERAFFDTGTTGETLDPFSTDIPDPFYRFGRRAGGFRIEYLPPILGPHLHVFINGECKGTVSMYDRTADHLAHLPPDQRDVLELRYGMRDGRYRARAEVAQSIRRSIDYVRDRTYGALTAIRLGQVISEYRRPLGFIPLDAQHKLGS